MSWIYYEILIIDGILPSLLQTPGMFVKNKTYMQVFERAIVSSVSIVIYSYKQAYA